MTFEIFHAAKLVDLGDSPLKNAFLYYIIKKIHVIRVNTCIVRCQVCQNEIVETTVLFTKSMTYSAEYSRLHNLKKI